MATVAGKLRGFAESAVQRVERQDWLEPITERIQQAIIAAYEAGGVTGRRLRDALHGTWLGHPLHPVLTDIPIGAWMVAATLDLLSRDGTRRYDRAADAAIGIGLVGAVGAGVTGMTDWQHTVAQDRRVGFVHGMLNVSATALYTISLALRRRGARATGRTFADLGFAVALGAAYLGGHLVYRKRIGIDHAPRPEWDDFLAALPERELTESIPRRVDVRGVAVVLVRRAGRVYALAETCAHLGGPLSEGQVDDAGIRCPWHGSRFALEDGRILEGPSTYTQPCFEVRIRGGQIEVRSPSAAL